MPDAPTENKRISRIESLKADLTVILEQMGALHAQAHKTIWEFYRIGVEHGVAGAPKVRRGGRSAVRRTMPQGGFAGQAIW